MDVPQLSPRIQHAPIPSSKFTLGAALIPDIPTGGRGNRQGILKPRSERPQGHSACGREGEKSGQSGSLTLELG